MSTSNTAAPVIAGDETPEAPAPSPTLVLFAQVVENRAADNYDGGLLAFQALRGKNPDLVDARLVLSAMHDGFLISYPWKSRTAKQGRYFKITIEEVPASVLPPDPAAKAPPSPGKLFGTQVRIDAASLLASPPAQS